MVDLIKQLTGKNQTEYENAASHIVNSADSKAFKTLVDKDDFLFDFVKNNVVKRLNKYVNQQNVLNLLHFLKYYAPTYEDFIVTSLVKFANEDLTDIMLEKFQNGTDEEKTYCARYFYFVNDSLALEYLNYNAFSEFEPLAFNCANALRQFNDRELFNKSLANLACEDEFKKLQAVKFLTAYGDKTILKDIYKTLENSSFAENIACEIPYLDNFSNSLNTDLEENVILALCNILNGLGEVIGLNQIFTFELYDIINYFINNKLTPKRAVFLNKAKSVFNQLTENDEYIFDESKEVKEEVFAIKNLLNEKRFNVDLSEELNENSKLLFFALEFVTDFNQIKPLLKSNNPTIILAALNIAKTQNKIDSINKKDILSRITNDTIKEIIQSL